MKKRLLSIFLSLAMLASATLIPTTVTAVETEPDTAPVSDVDTSVADTSVPETAPLAEAELEASPAPVVDAPAATVADENLFTYTVSSGKATITDVDTSIAGNIIIPDTLGGYPVTSIGESAFYRCSSLTSVTIPDSVTSIGDMAFFDCSSLTSVTIGNSVTSIGRYAFSGCDSLTSVTIPDSVTSIGEAAFAYCYSLTSVTIGNKVTSIGSFAFQHCYKLIEVYNRSSLSITAGSSSYGYVGYYAKDIYTSMSSVSKLFTFEDYLFYNDNGSYLLMEYHGTDSDISLPDTVNGEEYAIYEYAFYERGDLTSVTIPDSVTSIGNYAFRSCSSLTSVTIGNKVTSIGWYAFEYCSSLTSVIIGNSVKSIGEYAFEDCYKLIEVYNRSSLSITAGSYSYGYVGDYAKNVYTPSSGESKLFTLGDYLFYNDNGSYLLVAYTGNDTDITLPDTVNGKEYAIYEYAFYGRDDLTSVTIPDSVTSIGYRAFEYCSSLMSVTIGGSVTSIGEYAFCSTGVYNDASNWENGVLYIDNHLIEASTTLSGEYTIKDGTVCIVSYAFRSCSSLTSVTIPDSVTNIGEWAFARCSSLTSVTIGGSVTSIGEGTFDGCSSLTSVAIGGSVTSIGNYAFYYCHSLTSVTIPDSVTSIGSYAFAYCDSLASATIGNSVTWIGSSAFYDCSSLASITVAAGNTKYHSAGNCLIETASKTLVLGCKNSVIPTDGNVTSIGSYAFSGCSGLTSVTIPDSVTSIGEWAFRDCDSLTSVTIGESVTSIGDYAFYNCSSLTSVTIGNSVTSIGIYAFYYCRSLTSVTIGNSVTSIGSFAFEGCSSLTSVYITDLAAWCQISFDGSNANPLCNGGNLYLNGELVTDLVIPDSVTSIGNSAFQYCSSLALVIIESAAIAKNLTFSSSCGYLCNYAQTVVIPSTVTEVGSYVTSNFTNVDSLMIGGVLHTVYSKHTHAVDDACWQSGARGMTCTNCGLMRDFVEGEEPLYTLGDINADDIVDIADIAAVIDAASGTVLDPANYPGDPDVNADGVVDIADIAKVIDVAAGAAS